MFAMQNLTAGQLNALVKKLGGEEGALRYLRDELVISEAVEKKLLEPLFVVTLPAISQFVVADKFRPGETIDGIKVAWLGENFKKHILPKIEGAVAGAERSVHKLLENKRDPAIITALGGEEQVESSAGQFWEFLKTADQSFWYVAYIRDTEHVLWAVDADWHGDGLHVEASSLGSPYDWRAGRRFLSC